MKFNNINPRILEITYEKKRLENTFIYIFGCEKSN